MATIQNTSKILLSILQTALFGTQFNTNLKISHTEQEWKDLYKMAQQHGVVSIIYDAIADFSKEQQPPRHIKLQWALSADIIKKRYHKQYALASALASLYASNNINTIVLKGHAISKYYPIPEDRECGDLDCFLVNVDNSKPRCIAIHNNNLPKCRYADGNVIAKEAGAKVNVGFYKHSHINYKGLIVENHAFCTAIRGSRQRKDLERHLQMLLATQSCTSIGDTGLLCPSADFNALFLTAHSFQHFLTEGIKLRHVLDWGLLLKHEQHNIDWKSFYEWCDKMHYTKFADALTAIAIEDLGIEITNSNIHTKSKYKDKVLEDILFSNNTIHNTNASTLKKRLMIIRNKLFGGWKYRELYERSALVDTIQMIIAFFIERKPQI